MNYSAMSTEKLEALQASLEEKTVEYSGMSFVSPRSELVSYEIDFVGFEDVLINVNHYYKGLIRDYTVTILDGVQDDVEYNRYNEDGECIDGGYMSFDRLPKDVRKAVCELSSIYEELEKIGNILDARAEEEEEEENSLPVFFNDEEEESEEESEEETMYIVEGVSIVGARDVTVDTDNTVHGTIFLNVRGEAVQDRFHVHHCRGLKWVIFGLDTDFPAFSPFNALMKSHGVNMYNLKEQQYAYNAIMHYVSDML